MTLTARKIAIIGEAWGDQELMARAPFVGPAGQELDRMLAEANILRSQCHLTNVFNLHPERNDLATLCGGKRDGNVLTELPPLVKGKYLRQEYKGEVDRVLRELREVQPNVAILLGNTACWAVLRDSGISKIRGTARLSPIIDGLKCVPAYHPSAVLREYSLRPVTILDLQKAKRESEFPELRRPRREIWLEPTLEDIRRFIQDHLTNASRIAFDIETDRGEQITCIGFAPSEKLALVIPFVDPRKPRGNYWSSLEDELEAWNLVQSILDLSIPTFGQNGLYDIQYLWRKYGITVRDYAHDTMLLHHSLLPESPKGLGYLGSVYTNEVAWKADRIRGKETLKAEDD